MLRYGLAHPSWKCRRPQGLPLPLSASPDHLLCIWEGRIVGAQDWLKRKRQLLSVSTANPYTFWGVAGRSGVWRERRGAPGGLRRLAVSLPGTS